MWPRRQLTSNKGFAQGKCNRPRATPGIKDAQAGRENRRPHKKCSEPLPIPNQANESIVLSVAFAKELAGIDLVAIRSSVKTRHAAIPMLLNNLGTSL